MSVNPASRYATMEALVEHRTFIIDDTSLLRRTVDKVQWEGHFYSSKPPLLATLCAPIYGIVRGVTGVGFREAMYPTVRRMRLFVGVLPWLAAMAVFLALSRRACADPLSASAIACAMIVGGLPTAYAAHLDNHSFAFLALLGAALAGAPLAEGKPIPTVNAAIAGFLGGAAVTFDLGATPMVGLLSLWGMWHARDQRRTLLVFVACGLVAPLCQTAILYASTGNLKPFYLIPSAYQYDGSYWGNPVEFDALREPAPVYAFHALIGHHGLFSVTPWLLLGLPWFFQRETTPRAESLRRVAIAAVLFIVAYYVHRTINYGGRCVGMRWFMVLHPVLAVAVLRTAQRTDIIRRWPIAVGVLVAFSAVNALGGAVNPWEEGFTFALFRAVGLGSVPG